MILVLRRLRQENEKFEAILSYRRSCLRKQVLGLKADATTVQLTYFYFMCIGVLPAWISVWGCWVPRNWSCRQL